MPSKAQNRARQYRYNMKYKVRRMKGDEEE